MPGRAWGRTGANGEKGGGGRAQRGVDALATSPGSPAGRSCRLTRRHTLPRILTSRDSKPSGDLGDCLPELRLARCLGSRF